MKKRSVFVLGTLCAFGIAGNASALLFDQNVTSNAIYGGGNTNGSFTVDRSGGVELGLRGKLRHNAVGAPENTFNSNGDGTYSFDAGVAPTQAAPTAVWSFEWSINSNFDGSTAWNLDDLTYTLGLDTQATQGTYFVEFDPINNANPATLGGYWDHSIGTNATAQSAGVEAGDIGTYQNLLANNNLAQNSWKAHWYIPGFNPTVDGTYDIYLAAYDDLGNEVARSDIQIIVGAGGAPVPEPATLSLLALGLAGLGARFRARKIA